MFGRSGRGKVHLKYSRITMKEFGLLEYQQSLSIAWRIWDDAHKSADVPREYNTLLIFIKSSEERYRGMNETMIFSNLYDESVTIIIKA